MSVARVSAAEAATLWGIVPQSARAGVAEILGEKVGGARVSRLPALSDGRFVFVNVAAGDYVVRLVDASGRTLAQSHVARVQSSIATEAVFDDRPAPSPTLSAAGSGRSSKALVIVGAAALAGVGAAIAIAANEDPPPASPIR
jgi:hypothetical protein